MSDPAIRNLEAADIEALKATLKRYPYLVYYDGTSLGPVDGVPTVSPQVETKDTVFYETNGQSVGSIIVKNEVEVTISTKKVEHAMELLHDFKVGDDVYASTRKKELLFVPITNDTTQPIIRFQAAYLQPGLDYKPGESADPSVVALKFVCKPDENGYPWYKGAIPVTSGGLVTSGGQI